MADLRKLFERLGYHNIETVLATGNVIFEASQSNRMDIASQIERAIASAYDYETVAILYTKAELGDLIEADPFHSISPSTQSSPQVSFTQRNSCRLPFDTPVLATWVIRLDLRVNRLKGRYHTALHDLHPRTGNSRMRKFLAWLQKRIKHWIKPAHPRLISGLLSDLTRNRTDLVVENALLRQQLIVLKRQVK